ncbi:MAG: hypothetical protein WED10_00140 [Brumimicrobium sp.]
MKLVILVLIFLNATYSFSQSGNFLLDNLDQRIDSLTEYCNDSIIVLEIIELRDFDKEVIDTVKRYSLVQKCDKDKIVRILYDQKNVLVRVDSICFKNDILEKSFQSNTVLTISSFRRNRGVKTGYVEDVIVQRVEHLDSLGSKVIKEEILFRNGRKRIVDYKYGVSYKEELISEYDSNGKLESVRRLIYQW